MMSIGFDVGTGTPQAAVDPSISAQNERRDSLEEMVMVSSYRNNY
ncbi:MAG: hypothetical protein ACJAXK_000259 [Yoonia sp.]|jgi:hypothetical protein